MNYVVESQLREDFLEHFLVEGHLNKVRYGNNMRCLAAVNERNNGTNIDVLLIHLLHVFLKCPSFAMFTPQKRT